MRQPAIGNALERLSHSRTIQFPQYNHKYTAMYISGSKYTYMRRRRTQPSKRPCNRPHADRKHRAGE